MPKKKKARNKKSEVKPLFSVIGIFFSPFSLLFPLLIIFGCATKEPDYGADIRSALGVDEHTPEATEGSVEKYYDPITIIKRAEAFYGKGEYSEAVDEYKHFVSLHPLHELAHYAQFKLGLGYLKQAKTIDRDPEPFIMALQAFNKLLADYPTTKYLADAKEKIKFCKENLAKHEFYVGNFYYNQGNYSAAIYRFQKIADEYSDTGMLEEALYMTAISYKKLGDTTLAEKNLKELLNRHPDPTYRVKAERLLTSLNGGKSL